MTPTDHILIFEGSDGTRVFVCSFCAAQVGPVPKDIPMGAVELYHQPDCFYTEAKRMTAHHIMDKRVMQ